MALDVLLIDDDARWVNRYARALRAAGFVVRSVYYTDTAIEVLEREKGAIRLIIWDMMMGPGEVLRGVDTAGGLETGLHLLPKLKAACPQSKTLLLTARSEVTFNVAPFHSPKDGQYAYRKRDVEVSDIVDLVTEILGSPGGA